MVQKTKTSEFFLKVQHATEYFLTDRNRKKRIKMEKQKKKNAIVDWLGAFLWAAGMVLLVNQYLLQAYQIPSGSMIDTLNIKDHIFVNKLIYGPELLPGLLKLPSPVKPKRNDIIIFENPDYISKGTVFDIVQRIIYMLTISFVDIDKDEQGNPKAHFLIKRGVGMPGDRFIMENGEMKIKFAGTNQWVPERDYSASRGWDYHISRLIDVSEYSVVEAAGSAAAFNDLRLSVPQRINDAANGFANVKYPDYWTYEMSRLQTLRSAMPDDYRYRIAVARNRLGWYVPEGRMLTLGDNRDNSRDGRYFGPVKISKILGKGAFVYWPLSRMGNKR